MMKLLIISKKMDDLLAFFEEMTNQLYYQLVFFFLSYFYINAYASLMIYDYYDLVKSAMHGSEYYAAIRSKESGSVTALTIMTHVQNKQFGWKGMPEYWNPIIDECPNSILRLLTPTNNKLANAWRKRAKARNKAENKRRKAMRRLNAMNAGDVIAITSPFNSNACDKGQRVYLQKQANGDWYSGSCIGSYRWAKKYIPTEYEILSTTEKERLVW